MDTMRNNHPRDVFVHLIGNANAVYFLTAMHDDPTDEVERVVHSFFHGGSRSPQLFGCAPLIRRAAFNARIDHVERFASEVPQHVFPVYEKNLDIGFVIPFDAQLSRQWQVSDAFGSFIEGRAQTAIEGLFGLLRMIESDWRATHGSVLPTRWLTALHLRLLCTVHMAMFEGPSLQVPLLIAVARALGGSQDASGGLPVFGNNPVFSSGRLAGFDRDASEAGKFLPVGKVEKKLEAFVRELGPGHTALLTAQQIDGLAGRHDLLEAVIVVEVNSLRELLSLPEIESGLSALTNAYHPTLNEELVARPRCLPS